MLFSIEGPVTMRSRASTSSRSLSLSLSHDVDVCADLIDHGISSGVRFVGGGARDRFRQIER
jgi:hypothetical protein